ncbi:MAG: alpha/beta fold hydrolase [Nonlabens sp.]|uniref:alpha/beta hydrolase n=1 Tax=Nonlabens sp. TaxID=1888209 RepID=UPI00321A358D
MFVKKLFKRLLFIVLASYLLICGLLYFYQESLLFFPEKLEEDFTFEFKNKFIEKDIITSTGNTINTLHFKQENSKGVIYYLHGNGGSLKSVGNVSEHFLPLGYDVFMLDYAGYGKSSNEITNQQEWFEDVQFVYDDLKMNYEEDQIIVIGYSIGTGVASFIASQNDPSHLILHAPYYNMTDMMQRNYPFIPTFILRYELATNEYLKDCNMPVHIFHGEDDQVIPVESSVMLSKEFNIPFTKLENQGHNNMAGNPLALEQLNKILNE